MLDKILGIVLDKMRGENFPSFGEFFELAVIISYIHSLIIIGIGIQIYFEIHPVFAILLVFVVIILQFFLLAITQYIALLYPFPSVLGTYIIAETNLDKTWAYFFVAIHITILISGIIKLTNMHD